MREFTMRRPDDFHVHFRTGDLLRSVVPLTARQFGRALVMPNTVPAIANGLDITKYRLEIARAAGLSRDDFKPLMTFKITPQTTVWDVTSAWHSQACAGKVYPDGVTTNSQGGVTDFETLYPIFEAMQERGLVLCLHGEMPGIFCLDREERFLGVLCDIASSFPELRIVLEHITTQRAVEVVLNLPSTVAATITLHHLELTLDDVVGDLNRPHHFCKPIAKRPEDRAALRQAAFSGNPRFFFGSDSAPHPKERKECAEGCAGVFSAPVLLPGLVQLFDSAGELDKLEDFISRFGATFYGLRLNRRTVRLVQEEWQVPAEYGGVVPYKAGETLHWMVASP